MNDPIDQGLTVERADPHSAVVAGLVGDLCAELGRRYGRPPSPFTMDEATDPRAGLVVARWNGEPVGCGALRRIDATTVEVKRMYVAPAFRRRGVSRRILAKLEAVAKEHGYARIILETGARQPEALALYAASGYQRTANYGRYVGNPEAACFEKRLVAFPPVADAVPSAF